MKNLTTWVGCALVYAGLGTMAMSQERPPDQPFQAVHMMMVQPTEEKQLIAATREVNAAIAKYCAACIYHLAKVYGETVGPFNYMQYSNWPGREVYAKVHNSEEYQGAGKQYGNVLSLIYRVQIYNRYVEVKVGN